MHFEASRESSQLKPIFKGAVAIGQRVGPGWVGEDKGQDPVRHGGCKDKEGTWRFR